MRKRTRPVAAPDDPDILEVRFIIPLAGE